MSEKENKQAKRALEREELKNVTGGAASLSDLSRFTVTRADNVINPQRDFVQSFDTSGIDADLLNGFGSPEVRPGNDFQVVDPDWVSDSISVSVVCVGWSKDYTEPPPPPEPDDPDGGTGGGGGGGGAPGRFEGFDIDDVNLEGIGEQFGRGGGLNRG